MIIELRQLPYLLLATESCELAIGYKVASPIYAVTKGDIHERKKYYMDEEIPIEMAISRIPGKDEIYVGG